MNIHEKIAEQTELAATFARDGGFRTAARILNKLADDIIAHVDWADAELERFTSERKGK